MSKDLRRAQHVTVQLDRHDEPRDAVVLKAPPFTEELPKGKTRKRTDAALVKYPGTMSDDPLFGDIQEVVELEYIEE